MSVTRGDGDGREANPDGREAPQSAVAPSRWSHHPRDPGSLAPVHSGNAKIPLEKTGNGLVLVVKNEKGAQVIGQRGSQAQLAEHFDQIPE